MREHWPPLRLDQTTTIGGRHLVRSDWWRYHFPRWEVSRTMKSFMHQACNQDMSKNIRAIRKLSTDQGLDLKNGWRAHIDDVQRIDWWKSVCHPGCWFDKGDRQLVLSWAQSAKKGANYFNGGSIKWWGQPCTEHVELSKNIGTGSPPVKNPIDEWSVGT